MVWLVRHRKTKGPGTARSGLNNRVTSRLYSKNSPNKTRRSRLYIRIYGPCYPQIVRKSRNYKRLSVVERAFRSLKSVDLKVRPIHHHLADRVRAHVLLCLLAAYVEWHMKQALTPLLFTDEEPEAGEALRASVVAPALRSPAALEKIQSRRTPDGLAVHSFPSMLQHLATLTLNQVTAAGRTLKMISTPTPLQRRAFELLGIAPAI